MSKKTLQRAIVVALAPPLLYGLAPTVIAEEGTVLATVTSIGKRETRQVSEIKVDDTATTTPGTSPVKILATLPGVNFSSPDPIGAYEWGSRISIRGFAQNQLGFTLDDVPLGDMSYRNYNGLHISRAISAENIDRVALSQGNAAIGTASTSNLGGAVEFYSRDPSAEAGITVGQTFGEDSNTRTFVRGETGQFAGDTRAYASYTNQRGDKWKGPGKQTLEQINTKLVSDTGNAHISAFINYSDRQEADYMDLSKDSVNRLGYDWDYYAPNWQAAIDSANHVWHRGETSEDDAYYNGSGLREDWLGGVSVDYQINDSLSAKATIYQHTQEGTGTWWLPNPPAQPGPTPVALRTLEFDIDRHGVLGSVTYEAGIHKINVGAWVERNNFQNAMRFYAQDGGPSSLYKRPSNPYFTRWDYDFTTDTLQLHIQDTIAISEKLTLNVGVKSPRTKTAVESRDDTAAAFKLDGSLTAKKNALPQIGVNYVVDRRNELFADASQNIRAFRGVVKGGESPFDAQQAGFDAIKDRIDPESSTNIEAGWRHRQETFETGLAIYHVNFKDRLLAIQQGSAIAGNASTLANVGKVETQGIEGTFLWNPLEEIRWSNALSYNVSKYKDDFTTNGQTIEADGKYVTDAPKLIANSQLGYDDGSVYGHIGVNYIGKRYYSYVNDASVDAYSLWDLAAGYRLKGIGFAETLNFQLGVSNLFDKKFFAFGDNPFPTSDAAGTSYNLLAGSPRTVFGSVTATF